jgi:hypothetical protein
MITFWLRSWFGVWAARMMTTVGITALCSLLYHSTCQVLLWLVDSTQDVAIASVNTVVNATKDVAREYMWLHFGRAAIGCVVAATISGTALAIQ